jgi:hypothetical protein
MKKPMAHLQERHRHKTGTLSEASDKHFEDILG